MLGMGAWLRWTVFWSTCQLVVCQIRVLAPKTVAGSLANGRIEGSTATFGAPFYGEGVLGRLVYGPSKSNHHCTEDDYSVPAPEEYVPEGKSYKEVRLINIVLVERGDCTFVTKVKVAQAKQAHAVIIVDTEGSSRTSQQIRNIIVADDGYGENVHVPSVLISREDGDKLLKPLKQGTKVVVELNWDVPADDVVLVDLWMSSASLESQKFIKDFAPKRAVLNEYLQFVPHYHVFSMESSQDYKELCSDVTGRFCAEDPDVSGSVTGRDVLMEDVRQLCIHELTAITTDKRRKSSSMPIPLAVRQKLPFFSSQWWQYASILLDECPVDGKTSDRAFGPECSARVMRQVGIDVEKVEECVAETKEQKLEAQFVNTALGKPERGGRCRQKQR
ncbi:unnamed protein product [Effrenium voratum]|nr:unnamed protein product [Effrenium voratum]